jgi:hypothetical protein
MRPLSSTGLARHVQPLVEVGAAQIAVDDDGGLAGRRQEPAEVQQRRRLALPGGGAGHEDDLPALAAAGEQERRAQVLVGLGGEGGVVTAVTGNGGEELHVQAPLHVVGVLDRVVEGVAEEHEPRPEEQTGEERDEGELPLAGPHGADGHDRPVEEPHVVVLDRGGDVRLVQLLEKHGVEAGGGVGLLLERLELGQLEALLGGPRLVGFDGGLEIRLPAGQLPVLGAQALLDLGHPRLLVLLELGDLDLDLLDLRVPFLVLLAQAGEVQRQRLDAAVDLGDRLVLAHLGDGVGLALSTHVGELGELGLELDPAGLGLDVVLVQLGDGGGDRGDAALGHEEILTLVALQELVLGLFHVGLGLGEPLVDPPVGALGRLDLPLEAVVHVDVGQRVGPEGGVLGVVVRDPHLDDVGVGNRLHRHVTQKEPGGIGGGAELPLVGELQLGDDSLRDRPRLQDVELGVEELPVPYGVSGAHESVGDPERRRVGRHHLEESAGLIAGRLKLAGEHAEGEAADGGGEEQDASAPEQIGVVMDVEVALGQGEHRLHRHAVGGAGDRGRAHSRLAGTTT